MADNVVLEPLTIGVSLITSKIPSHYRLGLVTPMVVEKNTPANVTTNNNTNTDYVHRSEVENKQKVLRASENKSD